jgi:hypothetical protein
MNSAEKITRDNLIFHLRHGDAHMSIDQVVAAFPERDMNARLPNVPYTPWHILWHLWFCQWDILHYSLSADYRWPKFPDGYWPPVDELADQARWDKTVTDFQRDRDHIIALIEDASVDLFAPLPWGIESTHTLLRNFSVVADHNAYHIGEIGLWRAMLNNWPKNQQRDPGILVDPS